MSHSDHVSRITAELAQLEHRIGQAYFKINELEVQLRKDEQAKGLLESELKAHVTWKEVAKLDRKAADILLESLRKLGKTVRLTYLDNNRASGQCRIEERVIR